MGNRVNPIAQKIVDAIVEELASFGLIGRYAGDRETPYSDHLWDNNEVYMRGCKYGIAIFEGMPGHTEAKCGTNHNVLVEAGFMWGKGADVLVVRDPNLYSSLPTDLNGILHQTFDQKEEGLVQLRKAVRAWAKDIVEEKEQASEDKETESQ